MSINVGIVGCGGIASHHIRGYRQSGAKIVMVADLDQIAAQARAAELGCDWTTDYHKLLAHPDIQAISICVPNWLHFDVAMAAIEARKAVLCEKPMSISLQQAETLRQLVHDRNAFFQIGYMKRYHPVMQRFREWLPDIGPIEMGLLRCYQPFQNGCGRNPVPGLHRRTCPAAGLWCTVAVTCSISCTGAWEMCPLCRHAYT